MEHGPKPVLLNLEGRLEHAKWILEKHLHWITAAEVKAATVSAYDIALLGGLVAVYSEKGWDANSYLQGIAFAVSAFCLLAAIASVAASILPRTQGPENSFVFFGCVNAQTLAEYEVRLRSATGDELLSDCIAQIHRNAQIACQKFEWVRAATWWSLAGSAMWILAIVAAIHD